MKKMTLIVDDHPLFRKALSSVLQDMDNYQVTEELGDGQEALEYLKKNPIDLLILDLQIPGLNGVELVMALRKLNIPQPQILIISQLSEGPLWESVRHLSIQGFVLKIEGIQEVEMAIQRVSEGQTYFSPGVASRLWNNRKQVVNPSIDLISERERQVATLVSQGLSTSEIADTLGCAVSTVKTHRVNLMRKIGVKNSAEVSRWIMLNSQSSSTLTAP